MTEFVKNVNDNTSKYGIPADGALAWGAMFIMWYMKYDTLPILVTGGLIHAYVHPKICHCDTNQCSIPQCPSIQPVEQVRNKSRKYFSNMVSVI